ncbi:hypothetical protein [Rheinheimera texasensis]|uniref:hypothetical protein n=1 Tax=Rheinheimera texasensis TaxID=306205 RepID=UPI0032B28ED0
MWLAVAGEVGLVMALGLCALRCWRQRQTTPALQWWLLVLAVALGFIAINAAVGALRYAGVTEVIPVHMQLTAVSVGWMMPLYLAAALRLWGKLPGSVWGLWLVLALLPAVSALPGLLRDAMLVLALLRLIQQTPVRLSLTLALALLLAVPLINLLPLPADAALGLFHLLLAGHFYAVYRVVPVLSAPRLAS